VKICLFGLPGIATGKHNLKDPRLDLAHKLVEADKRTYAQVDVTGDDGLQDADAVVVSPDSLPDLILKDLEFIETRLGREPAEAEKAVLVKMQHHLEAGKCLCQAGLSEDEWKAVVAHSFCTRKPVVVASSEELQKPEPLMLRAFAESGYISFLTVGGKENRAWPIRKGATAWEAAGSIHTDIQKGFIRAEIISFADFEAAGGETQAKRAGKLRLETKQYVMQDYDITNFRHNK
jgi:ribosome-binding ATPase YchF (GTP1/OBG family)